jgi:SHAQKYF class myb-like DNA-binding protein
MSLLELDLDFPDLFPIENSNCLLNYSTLSDNLNDIFQDSVQEPRKKNIKFILTKEELPSISFLKKKINLNEENKELENMNGGRWNAEEQQRFAEAVLKYGNDWKQIQIYVNSRNMTQVRSHAQKFLMKLKETNFMVQNNIDLTLSWTKTMNILRSSVQYDELKKLLFSVEQNDEKKSEKKQSKKKVSKAKNKNRKDKGLDYSLNSGEYSKCDTNGDSFRFFLDNECDDKNIENIKLKEEEEENEALEKFIECFNNTSQDINLNSSFEDFSSNNKEEVPNHEKI